MYNLCGEKHVQQVQEIWVHTARTYLMKIYTSRAPWVLYWETMIVLYIQQTTFFNETNFHFLCIQEDP